MIFYGFAENLVVTDKFQKITIDNNFYLIPYRSQNRGVKYYLSSHNQKRIFSSWPILIYKLPGPETRSHGLWLPWEKMRRFAIAVRLATAKDCDCTVWFGLNDNGQPLKESIWGARLKNFDSFSLHDEKSHVDRKQLNIAKKLFKNIDLVDTQKDYTRLKNALTFYEYGYDEGAFIFKLINLFITLESLFSDDDKEISFKIALRVSWFLSPRDKVKRRELFNNLKKMYNLRSRLLHGDDFEKAAAKLHVSKNSYSYLSEALPQLSLIVTKVLFEIFIDKNKVAVFNASSQSEKRKLDSYLYELVF